MRYCQERTRSRVIETIAISLESPLGGIPILIRKERLGNIQLTLLRYSHPSESLAAMAASQTRNHTQGFY